MVRVQQASITQERNDTSPWSLVVSARPTEPPRDASTQYVDAALAHDPASRRRGHLARDWRARGSQRLLRRRAVQRRRPRESSSMRLRHPAPPTSWPAPSRGGASDAPVHIKGVFAIAAWSASGDRFLLARDPAGTYPQFFSEAGGRISCAVDAATLLRLPWVSSSINRLALADHLSHRWLSLHETHLTDVSRVPAGHVVVWEHGRRTIRRYWYPADPSGHIDWVRDDEVDQFHVHFDEAIDRCLRQGRTGIFLSGGFDSVSIAAAAVNLAARHGTRSADRGVARIPRSILQRAASAAECGRPARVGADLSTPRGHRCRCGPDSGGHRYQSRRDAADDACLAARLSGARRYPRAPGLQSCNRWRRRRRMAHRGTRVHGGPDSKGRCGRRRQHGLDRPQVLRPEPRTARLQYALGARLPSAARVVGTLRRYGASRRQGWRGTVSHSSKRGVRSGSCRIPISSASFASGWKRGPTRRSMSRSRAGPTASTSRRFRTASCIPSARSTRRRSSRAAAATGFESCSRSGIRI